MAVEVKTSTLSGCLVLSIRGTADSDVLSMVADGIVAVANDFHAVVIDVDELLLTNVHIVRGFLARLFEATPVERIAFHCRRHSGRRSLRRYGGDDLQVFDAMEDCLAAAGRTARACLGQGPAEELGPSAQLRPAEAPGRERSLRTG